MAFTRAGWTSARRWTCSTDMGCVCWECKDDYRSVLGYASTYSQIADSEQSLSGYLTVHRADKLPDEVCVSPVEVSKNKMLENWAEVQLILG